MNASLPWFHSKGYFQGVFWMISMCFVSNLNDIITKYMGSRLPGIEVAFFRFFFSTILLFPFIQAQKKKFFITRHSGIHFIRALLLVLAVIPWCYGVATLPLAISTTIGFTIPFFTLPLARIFLKEHVSWQRWSATFLGFIGIIFIAHSSENTFDTMALFLVASTAMFAILDIVNKKLLIKDESILSMLFYSALGAVILGAGPTFLTWKTPTIQEFFFLLLLGGGANLILFCMLKAYTATDVSAIQPFRYFELVLSGIFGTIIFYEWPTLRNLIGVAIIIPAGIFIAFYEIRQQHEKAIRKEFGLKEVA